MENKKALGPQKLPAAVLFACALAYSLYVAIFESQFIYVNAFGWLGYACTLAIIILLLIGQRNVGLPVAIGVRTLLSLYALAVSPGIHSLLWLAADALLLTIAILSVLPARAEKQHPLRGWEFLPAGLEFLPFLILLIEQAPFRPLYYVSGMVGVAAVWFLAGAMTYTRRTAADSPLQTAYAPYERPPAQQAAASPGVLLVRFSIEKLNGLGGSYGFQSGRLIGRAVPAPLLEGMAISDGDSAATLSGQEYVCIVAISAPDGAALRKIEPLILASEEIRACGAAPLTQVTAATREPLVQDGVVRGGRIEGPGGWCASGLEGAWKESAAAQPPPGPEKPKPFVPTNPRLASNMPPDALERVFLFTGGDGQTALACPVAMGTLADTLGEQPGSRLAQTPFDVIARSGVGTQIMQTGQFPQAAWTAMEHIDPARTARARAGALKTCVRTFRNPRSGEEGAWVLFYRQ